MGNVTLTDGDLAVSLRLATDADSVPTPILNTLATIGLGSAFLLELHAPDAPDQVLNLAYIALAGYMYETDPVDIRQSNPVFASGAASILSPYVKHNAGALTPSERVDAGFVPAPPPDGHFILTSNNGAFSWAEFPAPSAPSS